MWYRKLGTFPIDSKMANYRDEQTSELEALQAMYSEEELEVLEDLKGFVITVSSECYEDNEQLSVELEVEYVDEYPDALPRFCLKPLNELDDKLVKELEVSLLESAEENKGMVMGFTLVSALQIKLNEIVDQIQEQKDQEAKKIEEEEKIKEEMRFKGTPVTKESFTAWKENFDRKIAEKTKAEIDQSKMKLTGKQMFERDASLAKSDAQLLDDD